MTLRTVGSLVGALNGAKDVQAMAASFFINFRAHANGVGDVQIPSEPFVVVAQSVAGTADRPRLSFALVWTETVTWQVTDYHAPDSFAFDESWGADNSCGYHIESEDRQRQTLITVDAECLLMSSDRQIEMMRRWKVDADTAKKERARVAKIAELQGQIEALQRHSQGGSDGN